MKGTGWFVVIPMILRLQERQIWTFARVPHVKGGSHKIGDWYREGIVSKKITVPYRSGPSKVWIKVKNPKAPAAVRVLDGMF